MKKKETYYEFKNINGSFGWGSVVEGDYRYGSFEYDSDDDIINELIEKVGNDNLGYELWEFIKTQSKRLKNIRATELHFQLELQNGKWRVDYDYFRIDWEGKNDEVWDKEGGFFIPKKKVIEFFNKLSKEVKFQYNPNKSFEFSWCLDDIEEINEDDNTYNEDCDYILKKLMKTNQISKGERCKGVVSWDDSKSPITYKVDYTYCSQLGEDWDDDTWIDKVVKIKLN